jgi:hypothetical protein
MALADYLKPLRGGTLVESTINQFVPSGFEETIAAMQRNFAWLRGETAESRNTRR